MSLTTLTAISPIDGRYRNKVAELGKYFSEFGLMKYRVLTEVEYFIALCELPLPQLSDFDKGFYDALRSIYNDFNTDDATKIKDTEKVTNHDVKAVEYFISDKLNQFDSKELIPWIHFALTSDDINNLDYSLI